MDDQTAFDPTPGQIDEVMPGIRRILAPNPSPMTFRGTNTYLVGDSDLAVIDPGPDDPAHLEAILHAVRRGQRITHILVSHSHLDHSPLARPLAEQTGAPVLAFGDATSGRSAVMQQLADTGMPGGGEGLDLGFEPDVALTDRTLVEGSGWTIEALHTPGHLGNHLCFAMGEICFTADHVMGWSTSLVSPPDGDLTDFMQSCEKLRAHPWRLFLPGHGAAIVDPQQRLDWLISHRLGRETAILEALRAKPGTARDLAERVYKETPATLLPAAARNVFAHLIDLKGKSEVAYAGRLSPDTEFKAVKK